MIVSAVLPDGVKTFTYKDGVWLTDRNSCLGLATALRYAILQIHHAKALSEGKGSKMDLLYTYLSGTEFKQRVEGIIDAFSNLQADLEMEKRWFTKKWAKQEKHIRQVIDQTHGMHGDLQSIMGASLPEIHQLALPDLIE